MDRLMCAFIVVVAVAGTQSRPMSTREELLSGKEEEKASNFNYRDSNFNFNEKELDMLVRELSQDPAFVEWLLNAREADIPTAEPPASEAASTAPETTAAPTTSQPTTQSPQTDPPTQPPTAVSGSDTNADAQALCQSAKTLFSSDLDSPKRSVYINLLVILCKFVSIDLDEQPTTAPPTTQAQQGGKLDRLKKLIDALKQQVAVGEPEDDDSDEEVQTTPVPTTAASDDEGTTAAFSETVNNWKVLLNAWKQEQHENPQVEVAPEEENGTGSSDNSAGGSQSGSDKWNVLLTALNQPNNNANSDNQQSEPVVPEQTKVDQQNETTQERESEFLTAREELLAGMEEEKASNFNYKDSNFNYRDSNFLNKARELLADMEEEKDSNFNFRDSNFLTKARDELMEEESKELTAYERERLNFDQQLRSLELENERLETESRLNFLERELLNLLQLDSKKRGMW